MKKENVYLTSYRDEHGNRTGDIKPLWLKQRKLTPNRFRKLAQLLKNLPAKHFCMQTWVTGAWGTVVPSEACGTTACIAGWATTMDFAKKRAVKLFLQRYPYSLEVGIFTSLPPSAMGWKTKEPTLAYFSSLELFFGLTEEEVEEIFFDVALSKTSAISLLLEKAKLIESEQSPTAQEFYLRFTR